MPDQDPPLARVPEARTVPKKRTRLSLVWIIPIIAAAAGVWIAVTKILNTGPEITIVFLSADGLEAGKTRITYNGLNVGVITHLRLAEDHQHVVATARMSPKTDEFLVKDTHFWIVRPRISGLNVTGLSTLISGNYIGVQLGQSKESERHFTALETPPLINGDNPGRYFTLKTSELGSLGTGSPIFFRQLQAGQVLSCDLEPGGKFLNVKIFIQSPYDRFINTGTRFWEASGIDVSLGANGLHIQTESLMSILAGGIAFETPTNETPSAVAAADSVFTLFHDRNKAFQPAARDPQTYLLVFKQSVRGLNVGAPVEIGGVIIGEVTKIDPQFDMKTTEFTVPVTITVDPQKHGVEFLDVPPGEDEKQFHQKAMSALVARGLRGELKTASLLSGAMYVSVSFFPDIPPVTLDWSKNPVELPTASSKLSSIEDSVASLLKNVDATVAGTRGTLTNADLLLRNLDQTLVTTRGTLTNADRMINNASTLIAPDSVFNAELINLLQQGGGAAQSLRVLADYLERHPEALIRGKTGEAKP